MQCECGSGQEFTVCCEPFIKGKKHAPTPEALMRSRYTAYVRSEIGYLRDTLAPEARAEFSETEARKWATQSVWKGLQIQKAEKNMVEFTASYQTGGKTYEHHEVSTFKQVDGRWYFLDGESHVHEEGQGHHHHHEPIKPMVRENPKVGRNDPCSCGSGKKYKKCCANATAQA